MSASPPAFTGHRIPPASPPLWTSPVPRGELARNPRPTGKGSGSECLMLRSLATWCHQCVIPPHRRCPRPQQSAGEAPTLSRFLRCPPRHPGEGAELCFLIHFPAVCGCECASVCESASAPVCVSGRRTPVCTLVCLRSMRDLAALWAGHLRPRAYGRGWEVGQDFLETGR